MANHVDEVQVRGKTYDIIDSKLRDLIAPTEQTLTATRNYNKGDHFFYNDVLCKVLTTITSGTALVENTNYSVDTTITKILNRKNEISYDATNHRIVIENGHS